MASTACRQIYVFHPRYLGYDFGPGHPLQPDRLRALNDLLESSGLFSGEHAGRLEPPVATEAELLLAHSEEYIRAVQAISEGRNEASADAIGLGAGDTPAFPGMHEIAATITGGTIAAVRAVMTGAAPHAFNPGGGLHHAMRDRASGFCLYNDMVAGISTAVVEHGARVLYIDLDVHHGDGVQAAFYDDPRVLTVSFHETGRYLFPGTGAVTELGVGAGVGYAVNVPLTAYTDDDSWLAAVHGILPALAQQFKPDLIVSQHGCDGHILDEQSHFLQTTRSMAEAAKLVHDLAHEHTGGRWVAAGGGGYDPVRVVPRAWALVWAAMSGLPTPEQLPEAWWQRWAPKAEGDLGRTFIDDPAIVPEIPRKAAVAEENRATVARVRELALSPSLRRAYRPAGVFTPPAVAQFPPGRVQRCTIKGQEVIIRERAPESMLRRLRVAADLHTFTPNADREARLLRKIASQPETNLIIAYTPKGEIVGQVTLAPAEGRWEDLPEVYEIAIEVAASFRGGGLAEQLLQMAVDAPYVENLIIIALGLSWHWDLARTGLSPYTYRDMIVRTFGAAGFKVYGTDDEDITSGEGNVLLARTGASIPSGLFDTFYGRLYKRDSWFGF